MTEIKDLTNELVKFRNDRQWQRYHTPKNLAISIAVEAAELMECYQWTGSPFNALTLKGSNEERLEHVEDEVADVFIYLLNFCEVEGIDLIQAARSKMKKNALKYPEHD